MDYNKQTAPERSTRADVVNTRLQFVSFALLILVIGPIITGMLVNYTETKLLACVNKAQDQLRSFISPPPGSSEPPRPDAAATSEMNAVVGQLDHAKQHISDLHDIQDAVVGVFGLLGLVAVFYSRKALQDARATLQDLDAERSKLAAVFNTANVGITLWDQNGMLLDSNPAALNILGQPSEDALRRHIEDAMRNAQDSRNLPGEDARPFVSGSTPFRPVTASPASTDAPQGSPLLREQGPAWRALRGETFADQEVRLTRPDGSAIITLFGGCPGRHGPDGTVTLGVNVFQDITARRASEQEMQELAAVDSRRALALESLFETAGHLSVSGTPQEMHAHLTQRVAHVLQVDRALLWKCDAECSALTPLTPAHGFEDAMLADLNIEAQQGEWAHDLLFHNATIRSSGFADETIGGLYRQLRAWNVTGVLAVPLIAHGKPVGILCALDRQAGEEFSDEDERILRTFAGQAAFVLHSADLYGRARDRSEQLAALARITQVINSSLELETIVPAFMTEARALFPYAQARLALLPAAIEGESWSQEYPDSDEEETDLLRRLRGKVKRSPQFADAGRRETAGGLSRAQSAAAPGGSPASKDVSDAGVGAGDVPLVQAWTVRAEERPLPAHLASRMMSLAPDDALHTVLATGKPHQDGVIAIPLIVNQQLLGALEFTAGDDANYGEHHLLLASQAGGQLATAVQNAQLYAEATHRAEQLDWSMQETHHRINNNLQAVLAILDLYVMEAEDAAGLPSPPSGGVSRQEMIAREGLAHAMREVRTITAVHELLSEDVRSSRVNARHMMDRLVPLLLTAPVTAGRRVQVDVDVQDVVLPSKLASALALAANELIVNGVRHGGRGRDALALRVELKHLAGQLILRVTDDGRGFPPGFQARSAAKIGLNLTSTLIERDFKGKLTYANDEALGGAVVTAAIPYVG